MLEIHKYHWLGVSGRVRHTVKIKIELSEVHITVNIVLSVFPTVKGNAISYAPIK